MTTTTQLEARLEALAALRVEIDHQIAVRRGALARVEASTQARARLASDIHVREELRAQVIAEITRLDEALRRFDRLATGAPIPLVELLDETTTTTQEGPL